MVSEQEDEEDKIRWRVEAEVCTQVFPFLFLHTHRCVQPKAHP
jgi:hypothetical protein